MDTEVTVTLTATEVEALRYYYVTDGQITEDLLLILNKVSEAAIN